MFQITNGRIITPSGILNGGSLIIDNGKIVDIYTSEKNIPEIQTLDAKGNYVAPGCIDMHVHGGAGHDFMEATPDAFYQIARAHAVHGTTSLYATLAASPRKTIDQAIDVCEKVMNKPEQGAHILGLHLEGNYLNMIMKGGQDPDNIYPPNPEEYKTLLKRTSCIKRWSAAPELTGGMEFGRYASDKGVLVALAHTIADYPIVKAAFKNGYTHATHFYNAMTGVHKNREFKHEGTIESIYITKGMTVEMIADGIHVPPAILRMIWMCKGVEQTALITDAMAAAICLNTPEVYDERIIIEDGVCKLKDRSALAGSIATADRLIRTCVLQADIPLSDAVRMASETPARIMNILDKKGTLEKGKDADIILFNENIHIQTTIVEGNIIYNLL